MRKNSKPPGNFTPSIVPFAPAPLAQPVAVQKTRQFEWGDDSTFIAEQRPVAAYFNPACDLVIRQQENADPRNDSFVFVRSANLDAFARQLFDLLGYSRGRSA